MIPRIPGACAIVASASCVSVPHDATWWEAEAIGDTSRVLDGGLRRGSATRGTLRVGSGVDLERAMGIAGTRVYVEGLTHGGRDGSQDVGDVQTYSNIDAAQTTQLSALWFEQTALDERLRYKLGKLDAAEEFGTFEAGGPFLSSSPGADPTMYLLPTYPSPAASANVFVELTPGLGFGAGVYDANEGDLAAEEWLAVDFEERFFIAQLTGHWHAAGGGAALVGGWSQTGELPTADGGTQDGTDGLFAAAQQTVWTDGPRSLQLFGQLGWSESDVAPIDRYTAFGGLVTGLVPGREEERTGLLVAEAQLGRSAGSGSETAIELFHELLWSENLSIQPDVQWILDPGGDGGPDDALVVTLRLTLSL